MFAILRSAIHRDLLLAWRRRSDVATAALFFMIVVSLFPLGLGPEPELLRRIAPGVIWVAALLASMLSLNRMFSSDLVDGVLEQMLISPMPLAPLVLARVFAHWLISGVPLVVIAPLLALQLGLAPDLLPVLVGSLALGTPILSLIGAIGAALTLDLRGGGVLLALLVLPLYVPVLIIGSGALDSAAAGQSPQPHLLLLTAFLVLAVVFAPWAIAAALRISVE
jgi:heme exporter protein B